MAISPGPAPGPPPTALHVSTGLAVRAKETRRATRAFRATPFAPVPVMAAMEAYRARLGFGRSSYSVLTTNPGEEQEELAPQAGRGCEDVVVVHPGSRVWRVGRGSQVFPREYPGAVLRRVRVPADWTAGRSRQRPSGGSADGRELVAQQLIDGRLVPEAMPWKTDELEHDLKQRLRVNKIRSVPQAHQLCASWNAQADATVIPDHNDPNRIEWAALDAGVTAATDIRSLRVPSIVLEPPTGAEQLALFATPKAPTRQEVALYRPLENGRLNDRDYTSLNACLNDVETVWRDAMRSELGLALRDLEDMRCVIVVPDTADRLLVQSLLDLALTQFRFRAAVPVFESVCASLGAGQSLCCVVDIGATTTRVSCVEDALVVPPTRMLQPYGGDDVTEFFYYLLRRAGLPYSEMDPAMNLQDAQLAKDLKERLCTADEFSLNMSVHDFFVRQPQQPTRKYQVKLYDEPINASMCLYFPQVMRFSRKLFWWKRRGKRSWYDEENDWFAEHSLTGEFGTGAGTGADGAAGGAIGSDERAGTPLPGASDTPVPADDAPQSAVAPATAADAETVAAQDDSTVTPEVLAQQVAEALDSEQLVLVDGRPAPTPPALDELILQSLEQYAETIADAPDACDRVRKLVQTLVLVGGGGAIPGFAEHLEARLNLFIAGWWERLRIVQRQRELADAPGDAPLPAVDLSPPAAVVIQNPREIDGKMLVWKGAAVFSKLDVTREMFTGAREWEDAGIERLYSKWLFPLDLESSV